MQVIIFIYFLNQPTQVSEFDFISKRLQKPSWLPSLLPKGITTLLRNGWLNKVDKPF